MIDLNGSSQIWLYAGVLIAFAVLVITLSFLGKGKSGTGGRREQNIAIIKHQIAELEEEYKEGLIDQVTFESAKREQEDALYRDLEDQDVGLTHTTSKDSRLGIVLTVLFIPVFSVLMYIQYGEPQAIAQSSINLRDMAATRQQQTASLESVVGKLEAKLEQQPSAKGYMMLGKTYLIIEQPEKSVTAYRKGLAIYPDDAEMKFGLADSLAVIANNSLTGEPEKLILEGLKVKPDNIKGLWLAGMAAKQRGDTSVAVTYWKKVASLLPKDSRDYEELTGLIAETEGVAVATIQKVETTSNNKVMAKITVAVDIAPAIKEKLKSEQTVFIYAKAASGPPMPLAAVRKQVKDLPLTVVLTDAMAMMPQFKLSAFKAFKVGARVSMSGTPTKQAGDITAGPVAASLGDDLKLSLDTIVE